MMRERERERQQYGDVGGDYDDNLGIMDDSICK